MPGRSEMMRASSVPLRAGLCGRGTQISPLQAPCGFIAHPVRPSNAFESISSDVRIILALLMPLIGDRAIDGQDGRCIWNNPPDHPPIRGGPDLARACAAEG